MAGTALTIHALDLGSVHGGGAGYRSIGFDLTQVSEHVTACWIHIESAAQATALRLGEASRRRTYLARGPVAVTAQCGLRRQLTAGGVSIVNGALGGYLSFDVWDEAPEVPSCGWGQIYLELETIAHAMEQCAA